MDLVDRLRRQAASLPELKLAVLFGSTARGEARKGSDVDLGILLDPDTREARNKVLLELDRAAGREVDVVFLHEAPPLLRFEISPGRHSSQGKGGRALDRLQGQGDGGLVGLGAYGTKDSSDDDSTSAGEGERWSGLTSSGGN